jgi:hypothetical protein
LLELTPLAEALPVKLHARDDLYIAHPTASTYAGVPHAPIHDIRLAPGADPDWEVTELSKHGLPGFNRVEMKPGSEQVLNIAGSPLLVTGRYGEGRTVAFTGFTPEYVERRADWDAKIVFPYLIDQEFAFRPATRAYFALFMRMLAEVTGRRPATPYGDILAARSQPLFEILQDQPAATLQLPTGVEATVSGGEAKVAFRVANGPQYARLVRVRAEWNTPETQAPYLTMFSDNYFDLSPSEAKEVSLDLRLPSGVRKPVEGRLIVEGSNVAAGNVPITLRPQ